MKVLVVCEESQAVCKEFRAIGHEAYSCDLKECSGGHPEWHIQGDAFAVIKSRQWDLIIMHPPCTHLTVAGNRHYAKGKDKHHLRIESAEFVQRLWDLATRLCSRVAMENPVGCISTMCKVPKAQYIQPYEYGHPARKKTGLWLCGLPKLERTHFDIEPEIKEYTRADGRKTTFSRDYMEGVDRSGKMKASTKRSKTYAGIAKAMSSQWGDL
ncbi:S-adenosyl-L-methionine-dependent methyltransferase [Vibrio phage 2.095.A._10N.286.46.E10]|nr:S-adenosyl-L-methionine-dependent methyltransferase [Vibrio phage 2.095.A._10N.286.46.E10]AUS02234.1 S-adenosyl-L-methionine-dependent methyltransferase [Vibrio phage 2.095.B._10N.286.46.E10]